MPDLVRSDLFVSLPLTAIMNQYVLNQQMFVADQIFPILPVTAPAGSYLHWQRGDFFRDDAKPRAPGTESYGVRFGVSQQPLFSVQVYALHNDIDDQLRASNVFNLDLDAAATRLVTNGLLMKRERDWAANFFVTGIWTHELTGVAASPSTNQFLQWNNANSTPISDIRLNKRIVGQLTGFTPNVLVLAPGVLDQLILHPSIAGRLVYTNAGLPDTNYLAGLFGVDRIVVPEATYNAGAEGATDDFEFVYGKNALLVYSAPNPSPLDPSGGYIFSWVSYTGAGIQGNRTSNFRMDELRSDRVEGEIAYDMKVVSPDLGVFFASAIA